MIVSLVCIIVDLGLYECQRLYVVVSILCVVIVIICLVYVSELLIV